MVFGAGLWTGLSHFWALASVLSLVIAVLASRSGVRCAALVLALGAVHGSVAVRAERDACRARLPADGRLSLTLRATDPAVREGLARARPLRSGCHGTVDVRWPRGVLPIAAGAVVAAEGRWVPGRRSFGRPWGTFIVREARQLRAEPTAAERLRNLTVNASRRLYGHRAPLVDALVLGSRSGMDEELKEDFARSGLVHLLSISGFHVGLLAGWVVLAGAALGLPRARALVVGAVVGVAYVLFLGWPAPAGRAAMLCALLAWCLVRQRHTTAATVLAVTCLGVLAMDPWALGDVGGWLSASALWGATVAGRWCHRTMGTGFLRTTLASSVGATLGTAPITAGVLGSVALAGIALNIVAIPLAAVAVPGVAASLLLSAVVPFAARAMAAGAGLALHGLELCATLGARVPLGHVTLAAEWRSAVPWVAVLLLAGWCIGRRNTLAVARRRLLATLAAASLLSAARAVPPRTAGDGALALHFLDVGQGDATAIRTPGGRWVLVDAGPRDQRFDAGRRVVAPYLLRHGARRLELFLLSHAHLDHFGGAASVFRRLPTRVMAEPGDASADPAYLELLARSAAAGVAWAPARAGFGFTLDGVRFDVLHPDTAWVAHGLDLNEDSAVLLVEYGAFRALLVGDAGFPAEERLAGRVGDIAVLKVGHHGSATASGEALLRELRPEVAVVSSGVNRYGHPSAEALHRLARARAAIWRTDQEGTVRVVTDGRSMDIRAGSRRHHAPLMRREGQS